ncbi:MAG: hypothetical protein R2753_08400 [Chitinophagales bacterium]
MRKLSFLILCCVLVWSCKPTTQEEREKKSIIDKIEDPERLVGESSAKSVSKKDFKNYEVATKSGVAFIISENATSASLSNIAISGKNFAQNISDTLKATDPLEEVLLADLNDDSFNEVYLITRSAGSGSYATIYGFSSYADKSFGQIYVPDLNISKEMPFGYMGHDSIFIENNQLIRTFPLYKSEDSNSKPTGEMATIIYDLVKGETGFILQPEL